jgi:hypothetical protein
MDLLIFRFLLKVGQVPILCQVLESLDLLE